PTAPAPTPAPAPAGTGGFIGWLKGLFGGGPAETPAPQQPARESLTFDPNRPRQNRRRGGGGRGPQGGFEGRDRGPRPEGAGESYGGQRGERGEGGRRRRRRGGRSRGRGPREGGYGGSESGASGGESPAS